MCQCSEVFESDVPTLGWYRLDPAVPVPAFKTESASCVDLVCSFRTLSPDVRVYSESDGKRYIIVDGSSVRVGTGLVADIPEGWQLQLYIRSGAALNSGAELTNSVGKVDEDYVEEIGLIVSAKKPFKLYEYTRIAQAELTPRYYWANVDLVHPPKLKTSRNGGFGSTGQ